MLEGHRADGKTIRSSLGGTIKGGVPSFLIVLFLFFYPMGRRAGQRLGRNRLENYERGLFRGAGRESADNLEKLA